MKESNVFKQLDSSDLIAYQSSVLKLIGTYYVNPEDIFEMIQDERVVYATLDNRQAVRSLFTSKIYHTEDNKIISYLGLVVSNSRRKDEVSSLMFKHLENVKNLEFQRKTKAYYYGLTGNFFAYKLVKDFFQNVHPTQYNTEKPNFYEYVVNHSGYSIEEGTLYKVINSPSIARYKPTYLEKIQRANEIYQFPYGFTVDETNGERMLIVCESADDTKFKKLHASFSQQWQ